MEHMAGLFDGDNLPSGYGDASAPTVRLAPGGRSVIPQQAPVAYGARWAPASPDQPRPATIPQNNQYTYVPQASGPQSATVGPYAGLYGATAAATVVGPVCPDPTNQAYAYQLRSDGAVILVKSPNAAGVGKAILPGTKGYAEIKAVVDACTARKPINPQVAAAAITAAGAIAAAALTPAGKTKKKKGAKFDAGVVATVPPDATSGFPTWVWVGGGLLALLGVGGAIYVATRKPA